MTVGTLEWYRIRVLGMSSIGFVYREFFNPSAYLWSICIMSHKYTEHLFNVLGTFARNEEIKYFTFH